MKQEKKIITGGLILAVLAILIFSVPPVTGQNEKDTHPELSEQEMLIACAGMAAVLIHLTPGLEIWTWLTVSECAIYLASIIGIAAAIYFAMLWLSGIRPGKLQGNALQIGGAVVIAPGGELRYLYREKYVGDHPQVAEILGAVSDGG